MEYQKEELGEVVDHVWHYSGGASLVATETYGGEVIRAFLVDINGSEFDIDPKSIKLGEYSAVYQRELAEEAAIEAREMMIAESVYIRSKIGRLL